MFTLKNATGAQRPWKPAPCPALVPAPAGQGRTARGPGDLRGALRPPPAPSRLAPRLSTSTSRPLPSLLGPRNFRSERGLVLTASRRLSQP